MILVRTVIELVKNRIHYINLCSNLIDPFSEALRRACNNNSFCELYEVIALASVLQCEIQSVYPYIDYRAEMKSMNAVYKPVDTSVPNNGRVIMFWTSCENELLTKTRLGDNGVWSPNHFVPLVQASRDDRTASIQRAIVIPEVKYKTV